MRDLRLFGREIGLEGAALEAIQLIAFLDFGSLREWPRFQKRSNARDDVDPIDCFDPPKELAALGDWPLDRLDDADRGRGARGGLRPAGPAGKARHEDYCQQSDRGFSKVHCRLLAPGSEFDWYASMLKKIKIIIKHKIHT